MSTARNQLRAVVNLTGLSPEQVAEKADIPIKRIREVLDNDWPLPKKHRDPSQPVTGCLLGRADRASLALRRGPERCAGRRVPC